MLIRNGSSYKILFLLFFLVSFQVCSAGIKKIGYINAERVYTETAQAQEVIKRLDVEFLERQKELLIRAEKIKELQNAEIKSFENKKRNQKLVEIISKYEEDRAHFLQEYALRRSEEFTSLQNKANEVIRDYAKRNKYDLILQDAVYINQDFDITNKIIKELDQGR